jgi:uncharacterized membrane protein
MVIIILGIFIFFTIHIVPSTPLKAKLVSCYGANVFKGVFSLISITGLGLIIYGLGEANFVVLWNPPTWSRAMLMSIMPIVAILWTVAEIPNNIKRWVRHPMLTAMIIWGLGHLMANGDLATTIVFASFTVFSVTNLFIVNARNLYQPPIKVNRLWDPGAIAVGLTLYGILFYFHGSFTGMPLW